MNRSYKYRLYPSEEDEKELERHLEPQCGVKTDIKLWKREHSCPSCGYTTDRDYNAALNILERGLEKSETIGPGQAEVTPAEAATSTEHKDQDAMFCDVSASCVIETGNPFKLEAVEA